MYENFEEQWEELKSQNLREGTQEIPVVLTIFEPDTLERKAETLQPKRICSVRRC
jgi:hypothetical protein